MRALPAVSANDTGLSEQQPAALIPIKQARDPRNVIRANFPVLS